MDRKYGWPNMRNALLGCSREVINVITTHNPEEMIRLIYRVNHALLGHARREEMELMAGTVATESHYAHREQIGGGPARGLFQIEPDTAYDVYHNYLAYQNRRPLYNRMMGLVFDMPSAPFFIAEKPEIARLLMYDDYSACIARFCYLRRRPPIPTTLEGQAEYYKRWFNTEAGEGSVEKYLVDWYDCNCPALVRLVID